MQFGSVFITRYTWNLTAVSIHMLLRIYVVEVVFLLSHTMVYFNGTL